MRSLLTRLHFSLKYFSNPPWDTGNPAPELVNWVDGRIPGSALDVGCGTGTNLLYLASKGWKVSGVDYAPLAIIRARYRFLWAGLKANLLIGDYTRLPEATLKGPFDLILDIGCLHAFSSDEESVNQYVDAVYNRLCAGGTFLLYAHMPEGDESSRPWHGISPERVKAVFGAGFSLQAIEFGEDKGRQSAWYTFIKG
jgi:SAM-dependent methyltransferase